MPQCRDGTGQVMSGAWFPLDVQTSEFDLCFSCSESPSGDFWQTPGAFYLGVTSVWPLYHIGLLEWNSAEMVVLLEDSPLFTEQCWSSVRMTIGSLATSLTKEIPFTPIVQIGRAVCSWKSPGVSRLLFTDDGCYCSHLTFNATDIFLYPSPNLCLYTRSCLRGQRSFLGLHGSVYALTCTVNYGTLYKQVCACPNHEFT